MPSPERPVHTGVRAAAMPVFAPLFQPGTEEVTVRWLTVHVPVAAEVSDAVLPQGLTSAAEPTVGLWIAEFIGAEFHSVSGVERRPSYLQGGLSLRCRRDGGADGAYALLTYVAGLNHGILGRELFGLPKKQLRSVTLDEEAGRLRFAMTSALGEPLVAGEAELGPTAHAAPAPDWFRRHFTVKAIPSAEGPGTDGPAFDVCKLVEIPWRMTDAAPVRGGAASLVWGGGSSDPLHLFAPTQPPSARYGTARLGIDYGKYLADVEPPHAFGRPSWG
ncbi:acetoacetate decarboxylase family protein [Pseudonocardia sp. MH-G8]|uniref:acetoacetate decarboxylase family protein n=1 Tax=Pseudonocardia sp. MH-G8 TaxID=1854588 RepID=UPI0018E94445|nr:acetoacetate decarboxylase family protein [Pseudonocardia sp. MH-G8]